MEPFLAQVVIFAGNFAPRGWAFCEGQLLPISQYSALFSLLGTIYGGDGRTTFALPDLRGRTAIGPGTGPGLPGYREGSRGGAPTTTLNITHLPNHNHTAAGTTYAYFQPPTGFATESSPSGNSFAAPSGGTNIYSTESPNLSMKANNVAVTVGNTGGQQAFSNMQPYLPVYYIIALQGTFPSRS